MTFIPFDADRPGAIPVKFQYHQQRARAVKIALKIDGQFYRMEKRAAQCGHPWTNAGNSRRPLEQRAGI
jgi:hypothetical protein